MRKRRNGFHHGSELAAPSSHGGYKHLISDSIAESLILRGCHPLPCRCYFSKTPPKSTSSLPHNPFSITQLQLPHLLKPETWLQPISWNWQIHLLHQRAQPPDLATVLEKGKEKKRREKSLLTLGQCVGPHFLAFSVENITKCWVPKGLSEIFGHYWVIENEL